MNDNDILRLLYRKNKTLTEEQKILLDKLLQLLRSCPSSHKKYGIDEIQSWIVNPLLEGNLFVLMRDSKVVAATTYAKINKNVSRKWFTDKRLSDREDWNSGNELWWIDCLAPEGDAKEICSILRNHLRSSGMRKKYINHIRIYKDGSYRINKSMI